MNHVRIKPTAIYWKNIGGHAVSITAISCVSDNGEGIIVHVRGKLMPIHITYDEARKVFAGWDGFEILPDEPLKKVGARKKSK
jgi:hypothetical protein